MHPSLQSISHRPWPLPAGHKWKWRQSWLDLAFIHYPIAASALLPLLPNGIQLQSYNGTAWLGVVPFRMAGVMKRPWPDMPYLSSFPELNLRTYVEAGGKPGVWFFSLDADSWPIVFGGRQFYHLPYFRADMHLNRDDDWWKFTSARRNGQAKFSARYRAVDNTFFAQPGTFEHWATERYCLYAHSKSNGISRVEVHHAPWLLQKAEVVIDQCELLTAAGISLENHQPICHFSSGVHVISFPGVPAI